MSNEIISVQNLQKVFKLKQKSLGVGGALKSIFKPEYKEIMAVNDVSFSIDEGEILAFIGPNGAGKSTTIKMLTGLIYPTSGQISVLGFDPSRERTKLAFHIGAIFGQKPQLWYHLPPQETYSLLEKIYEMDHKVFKERLGMIVEAFDLKDLMKIPVRKLSLGQRMRCEIAASFLHKPKIIFLDEPTIGLDVIAKQKIREVLLDLNKREKVTVFLTSHDTGDIEALAKRTMVINHGQVVFDGATDSLKKSFINKKIVEIVTEKPLIMEQIDGVNVLENEDCFLKLELNLAKITVADLLNYAAKNLALLDMNIYDPPMEDIIAEIYSEKRYEGKK